MVEEILLNIGEQTAAYSELLDCVNEQQQAIVASDVYSLDEINERERQITKKLNGLEQRRLELITALCAQKGLPEDSTLNAVCDNLAAGDAEKLRSAAGKLQTVLTQIKEVNSINSELIAMHIQFVDVLVETTARGVQTNNIYGAMGDEREETTAPGLFDAKI